MSKFNAHQESNATRSPLYKEFSDKLFLENEVRANRNAALGALCLVGFLVLATITPILGLYNLTSYTDYSYLISIGLSCALMIAIFLCTKGEKWWVKYALLFILLGIASRLNISFPVFGPIFYLFPILISSRYYMKALTETVVLLSIAFLTVSALLMWYWCVNDTQYAMLCTAMGVKVYSTPIKMLRYTCLPNAVVIAIFSVLIVRSSINGRKVIDELANAAAAAGETEHEIEMSARIQQSMLPKEFDIAPNGEFDIHALLTPAKDVAGDFYACYMPNEKTLAFGVADVSDKGLPAAMFMMSVSTTLRALAFDGREFGIEYAIDRTNKLLCKSGNDSMFVTMWAATINIETGEGQYLNAGHPPAFIKHADGSVARIEQKPQPFIGLFDDIDLKARDFQLLPGDTLLLYTDGLTDVENANKEMMGIDRLQDAFASTHGRASEITQCMKESAEEFAADGGSITDDVTMLALVWNGCATTSDTSNSEYDGEIELSTDDDVADTMLKTVNERLVATGCPEDIRRMIDVAIDEIATNISDYAYPDTTGRVWMGYRVAPDRFEAEIRDSGIEFDSTAVDEPYLGEDRPIGGLGIHFIRNIMDSFEYERVGSENVIRIAKRW